ncbi:MAG: hypothetical protein ACTSU9_03070 [Promethearchaeota archaeon]
MDTCCKLNLDDFIITREGKRVEFPVTWGGACVSAIHAAIPYVISFSDGAWFPWEKRKSMVQVLCPAGYVAMEIDLSSSGNCLISISECGSSCPKHHQGDKLELGAVPNETFEILDSAYPLMYYLMGKRDHACTFTIPSSNHHFSIKRVGTSRVEKTVTPCDLEMQVRDSHPEIEVIGMKHSCRYQRASSRHRGGQIIPEGYCFFSHHASYPHVLSMLYNGKPESNFRLKCPGVDARVTMELIRKEKTIHPFLKLLEKAFRLIKHPQDIIWNVMETRILEVKGSCPRLIKPGDTFKFGEKKRFCPSSFDNAFGSIISNLVKEHDEKNPACSCTSLPCRIRYMVRNYKKTID